MMDYQNFEPTFVVGDSEREWFLGWAEGYGTLVPVRTGSSPERFDTIEEAMKECEEAAEYTADPDNHIHKIMEGREWRVYRVALTEVAKPPAAKCDATLDLKIIGLRNVTVDCESDDGHAGEHKYMPVGGRAAIRWSNR